MSLWTSTVTSHFHILVMLLNEEFQGNNDVRWISTVTSHFHVLVMLLNEEFQGNNVHNFIFSIFFIYMTEILI